MGLPAATYVVRRHSAGEEREPGTRSVRPASRRLPMTAALALILLFALRLGSFL